MKPLHILVSLLLVAALVMSVALGDAAASPQVSQTSTTAVSGLSDMLGSSAEISSGTVSAAAALNTVAMLNHTLSDPEGPAIAGTSRTRPKAPFVAALEAMLAD